MNFKPGPAVTRDGREARIYATDGPKTYPIHGAINNGTHWAIAKWHVNGLARSTGENARDLMPPM